MGQLSLDHACQVLRIEPLSSGLQIRSARQIVAATRTAIITEAGPSGFDPFRGVYRAHDPAWPILIGDLAGRLGELREALVASYPEDHPVSLVTLADGSGQSTVERLVLRDLPDERTGAAPAFLYLEPTDRLADPAALDTLRYIVGRLRGPGGCPWDQEQTSESIKKHLIEETYEAVTALDDGDLPKFAEELGDVLLQVILHAQIAREAGEFALEDVLVAINQKLIRRHPHVFGDVVVQSSADVLRNWEKIKRTEKGARETSFGGVPEAAPALMRADAILSRAARYGWPTSPGALPSTELTEAESADRRLILGETLFDLVVLARQQHVDAEEALRMATNRFRDAFDRAVADCQREGVSFESLPIEERRQRVRPAPTHLSPPLT
jgi:tetrapyrrole methylase family protein / MazG family protein